MSQSFTAYPDYRRPAHPWIKQVPFHWDERRAKVFFREIDDRSVTGKEELLSVSHLTGVTPRSQKNVTMFKAESYVGHKRSEPGDIVINTMWAWMAALGVSRHLGLVSPAYGVYRTLAPEIYNPFFVDYLVRSEAYVAEYNCRSTGIQSSRLRLYPAQFLDIPFIRPPREEQDQIVAYLRAQDAQITRFIRDKRRLIELLNEQKQALIHRAVTRGLDRHVCLRPSGLEWLGEVPDHWAKVHLGSDVQLINGFPFDAQRFSPERGHQLIRIRDLYSTNTTVRFDGDEVADAVVDTGDLLIGMDGDFNAALWQGGRALLNQRVCCIRSKRKLQTEYLVLLLPFALKYINDSTLSTTVKHLSSIDINRLRFPAPSGNEQMRIARAVAEEVAPLDATITHERESIKLMREYRDRLIADVVTGQIDVRSWAPGPDDLIDDSEVTLEIEAEEAMHEQGENDDDDGHE